MINKNRIEGVLQCPHCKSSEGFYMKAEVLQKVNVVFSFRGEEISRQSKPDNMIKERLISPKAFCVRCKKIISTHTVCTSR